MIETIISIDIETDGHTPGLHSMRSLGAVAYDGEGQEIDTWYRVMLPLPGAVTDPATMQWWSEQDAAMRQEVFYNPEAMDPGIATAQFAEWLATFVKPKMLAAPAGFDFTFVRYYLGRFVGYDRIWHNCIDLRSVAMPAVNGMKYGGKIRYGADIKVAVGAQDEVHDHHALHDAREQGRLFWSIVKHWKEKQ